MKCWAVCLIVGLLIAAPGMVLGQGITGTDHDFSGEAWNTTGEICVVCHTPHNATTTVANAPLWNHAVTTATFTTYTGADMDATVGQPSGVSKLCLSCHDGTVALDSFGGSTGSTTISGSALVGTDLSNDHPVSFTYNDALAAADGELATPSTDVSGLGGTIEADMLFGAAGSKKLECASCHDVHDNTNSPFLVKANSSSALCRTCHNK